MIQWRAPCLTPHPTICMYISQNTSNPTIRKTAPFSSVTLALRGRGGGGGGGGGMAAGLFIVVIIKLIYNSIINKDNSHTSNGPNYPQCQTTCLSHSSPKHNSQTISTIQITQGGYESRQEYSATVDYVYIYFCNT